MTFFPLVFLNLGYFTEVDKQVQNPFTGQSLCGGLRQHLMFMLVCIACITQML